MSDNDTSKARQMLLWGFPSAAFVATWLYWPLVCGTGLAFPLYLLTFPVPFALVVVPLAMKHLRLWKWNLPAALLTFMWSTYSALGALIISDTIAAPFSVTMLAKSVAFSALVGAAIGTIIDVVGIDEGLLEVYHTPRHLGTVKTVLSYSFKFFGIFGAIYGAGAKVGYYLLVEHGATLWLPALILGGSAVLALPFLLYFLLPDRGRRLELPRAE